ncbi:MAG TPA: hypothetical protein V6C76_17755 [Drouetiella sp.]
MRNEISINDTKYGPDDDALKLLGLLRRHLDQTLPDSVYLQQDELFSLKAWLLQHAESMKTGKAIWIEESNDGIIFRLVAAVGKTDEGASVLWHEPLPWPFPFINQSYRVEE